MMTLTEADNGRALNLIPGQTFDVVVETNPSTGYAWQADGLVDGVLELLGEPVYTAFAGNDPSGRPLIGGGGRQTWSFIALRRGEATLRLSYRRPWEPSGAATTVELSVVIGVYCEC